MSIQLSLERISIYTWFFLKERSNNGDFFDYHGQNLKKTASSHKKTRVLHTTGMPTVRYPR